MSKKIIIILVLLVIVAAAAMYFISMKDTALEQNEEVTAELTSEEAQAIELLNDEVIRDQCVVYADEDNVKDEELEEYLTSCVEQLKAEATMIEPENDAKTQEEILKQCSTYAQQDAIAKDKLDEYMDLCIEQLRAEATMVDPDEEIAEEQTEAQVEEQTKKQTEEKSTDTATPKADTTSTTDNAPVMLVVPTTPKISPTVDASSESNKKDSE